ncbi:MAG: ribose-phosphate pyrophosphokinase [Deltaproteobacteria bacterium]|nr:MAG: ribose-phosphate pyrophosphokinase [Deltaproteobacteria bacterium]
MDESIKIFSGNANPGLAREVSDYLGQRLGACMVSTFADGEIQVSIDESVRGKDVYVLQSLAKPVNDSLMELLVMVDALKRSSARTITAVIPYFAYARQDRQARPRTPITAKLFADLLTASGVDRVMAMDLHAGQIQGFFSVPFEHLYATPVLIAAMREEMGSDAGEAVVVSPDAGGVERARVYSSKLGCGLAVIDKRRSRPNVAEVMNVIGEVEGKNAFILDDMIDTAGTLCNAAVALREKGARRVLALATHGLFNGPAGERINNSVLEKVIVTNTIPVAPEKLGSDRIQVLSVGALIGEAIRRVHGDSSVSSLWN